MRAPAAADGWRRGFPVARFQGIPIRVHWTLLLALPLFAWLMGNVYFEGGRLAWAWGAGVAVSLFASVALHELAHSAVALRRDTKIREIILLPIGGASIMETPSREPRAELLIAIAGPLASLALGGAVLAWALAAGVPLTWPHLVPPASAFLLAVGYLNVSLGLFNLLLPAFPMDGGRVLRALLARRMGLLRATRIAATTGRAVAFLMGVVGLLVWNLLLVLIAAFVWTGARAEEEAVVIAVSLEDVLVKDIMSERPATIGPEDDLEKALDVMLATKHLALPVLDGARPLALLKADEVARVPAPERRFRVAGEIATPGIATLREDARVADALQEVLGAGLVAVVDAAGRLQGVVTPSDVVRTVQIRTLAAGGA